jgi:hypothetical protein
MDLRDITNRIRRAVKDAGGEGKTGGTNIAAAINVGTDGKTTSVYSDDEVTIVQKDGETTVTRHREAEQTED